MKLIAISFTVMLCMSRAASGQDQHLTLASHYALGPEDLITVRVLGLHEFAPESLGAIRVDPQGDIKLPLTGRMNVAGLTVEDVEEGIGKRLNHLMVDPEVTVTVTEFGSRPVSVLGAVKSPGVRQIAGTRTLFEVLSLAGGLAADAGNTIRITRRIESGPLPLPGAARDANGPFFVGTLSVHSVMEAKDPAVNIEIRPNDVITVPQADFIYVVGAVKRSGGFALNQKEQLSTLQALSLAEGLDHGASAKSARILRQGAGMTARTEIPVNLGKMLEGGVEDIALRPNDILFVPVSKAKSVAMRSLEAAIQMGTGIVIWRR
jgi:polysaccharide export outer membrane protein